jgi:hypothetical protein
MAAQNLTGRVALDAFCADVPCGDNPVGIQHENGVLLDTLDKEAKSLLEAEQVFAPPGPLCFDKSPFS